MTDLVSLLGTLVDNKGKILIEGLDKLVAPLTEEEKALYPDIAFTMNDIYESLGSQTTIHDNTEQILMARCFTSFRVKLTSLIRARLCGCSNANQPKMALPLPLHPRRRGRLLGHGRKDRDPGLSLGQILGPYGAQHGAVGR